MTTRFPPVSPARVDLPRSGELTTASSNNRRPIPLPCRSTATNMDVKYNGFGTLVKYAGSIAHGFFVCRLNVPRILPFSRATLRIAAPLVVPREADESVRENKRLELENILKSLSES